MRLIDADALKEKFKEHYDLFVSAYKNEQDMSVEDKSRVDEILSGMAEVINAPTVCDIDAIRREIEDLYIITNPASDPYDGGYYTALIDVRRIIDKYKGE